MSRNALLEYMKSIICFFCFLFFEFIISNPALCQTNSSIDTLLISAINNLSQRYTTSVEYDGHLYNGKEYLSHDKYYLKGHQFFKSDEEQEGDVLYEGYLFKKIPLLYDVVLNQIVISEPNGSLQLKLDNNKVSYFKVHDHLFIRLETDTLSNSPIQPGFYDLLVDNKTQVLAKRTKKVFEDPTPRGMEGEFVKDDKFFIRRNNRYYPVSKKRTVLKVFTDYKKELQRYSRSQHLNFKKENREASLIKLVQYYETLPTHKQEIN